MKLTNYQKTTLRRASKIMESIAKREQEFLTSSTSTKSFFISKLLGKEVEVFSIAFLNNNMGLIEYCEMFTETLNSASVYAREIIKKALELNSNNIILAHNHPSGNLEVSSADKNITQAIFKAATIFDINVLDHIVVGRGLATSFSEEGLI